MKILIASLLLSFSIPAYCLEYQEKVKCYGDHCVKQTEYTGLSQKPIRIDEYRDGQCLVQIENSKPTFFKVLKAEPSIRKLTLLKEESHDLRTYVHVMKKLIIFDKAIESIYLKNIPCNETNSFFDQAQIDKCTSSKKFFDKLYCDIR